MPFPRALCLAMLLAAAPAFGQSPSVAAALPRADIRNPSSSGRLGQAQRFMGVRLRRRECRNKKAWSATGGVRQANHRALCFEPEERDRRHFLSSCGLVPPRRDSAGGLEGQRVLLHFGAVDYRARSGSTGSIRRHEGGTPRSASISRLLKEGANTIVVRAEDPPTDRYMPRGKQYWEPKSAASSTRAPRASGSRSGSKRPATATSRTCASPPTMEARSDSTPPRSAGRRQVLRAV